MTTLFPRPRERSQPSGTFLRPFGNIPEYSRLAGTFPAARVGTFPARGYSPARIPAGAGMFRSLKYTHEFTVPCVVWGEFKEVVRLRVEIHKSVVRT